MLTESNSKRLLCFLAFGLLLLVGCSSTEEGTEPGTSDAASDTRLDEDVEDDRDVVDSGSNEETSVDVEEPNETDLSTEEETDDGLNPTEDTGDPEEVDEPDTSFEFDTSDTSSETSEVNEALTLTGVSPERGPTGGGTEFILEGANLSSRTQVFFGGRRADVEYTGDRLVGLTPSVEIPQTVSIKAIDSQTGTDVMVDVFEYVEKLSIGRVQPQTVSNRGGVEVEIKGSGFNQKTRFSVGQKAAVKTTIVNPNLARIVVPPHEPGTVAIRAIGRDEVVEKSEALTYRASPEIDYVEPASVPANTSREVTVHGNGFAEDDRVEFGGASAAIQSLSSNGKQLKVDVPAGSAGLVDVSVQKANGSADLLTDGFYYRDGDDFSIESIQPDRGVESGGERVRLIGPGVGSSSTTFEFGLKRASIQQRGDGYVVVETPAHTVGTVDVTGTDGADTSTYDNGFEYLPELGLDAITPQQMQVSQLGTATLEGVGFNSVTRVTFGGISTTFNPESDSKIEAEVPSQPAGVVDVSVHRNALQKSLVDAFEYKQALRVDGFSPVRGSVAGGTRVVFRGKGFSENVKIRFDGEPLKNIERIDPFTVAGRTPSHRPGQVDVVVEQDGKTTELEDKFTYFNPGSRSGGVWGGPIEGAVNVSVFSRGGRPIEDAFVMLSTNKNTPYKGQTDSDGTFTLSGPEVFGEQTVTATAEGYSSATVQRVDAKNVTLFLSPEPSPGQPPPGPPTAVFEGELTGLDKIIEPGPNEDLMAIVQTTQRDIFTSNPNPGNGNVLMTDGTYRLTSRIGDLALVALGGLYNNQTSEFTPIKMGIKRYQMASQGQTYNVDIELDIRLDDPMTVKLPGAPEHPEGPDTNRVQPYLDFGFEGVFAGFLPIEAQSDTLTGQHFAELTGQLSDLSYLLEGGAYTGENAPSSVAYKRDVESIDSMVEMPKLPAIARVSTPASGQSPPDGLVQFNPGTVNKPDFYYVQVLTFQRATKWEAFIPGDATSFRFPEFPSFSELPPNKRPVPYPGGQYIMAIIGVEMDNANYDQLSFSDLSVDKWDAYSTWTQIMTF